VRKKALLIFAVCMAAIACASLLAWSALNTQDQTNFVINAIRNFSSQDELNALSQAESINYTDITSFERFHGSSDPQDYLHPGTYLSYTYANYIDLETINYYQTRYDNQQGKEGPQYPKGIEFTYEANASKHSEFQLYNSPAPEGVSWRNTTIIISADGSVVRKDSALVQFFYRNQSGYQTVDWGYNFNFTECYVVEMKLVYSEYYAPVAAFWSDVYQIVVFNRNLVPILIGVQSGGAVA
jgi:hypothetical protein